MKDTSRETRAKALSLKAAFEKLGVTYTISRFTCLEKAILFFSSFLAVLFLLLTQAEKGASSQLKPVKRIVILGHLNRLYIYLIGRYSALMKPLTQRLQAVGVCVPSVKSLTYWFQFVSE